MRKLLIITLIVFIWSCKEDTDFKAEARVSGLISFRTIEGDVETAEGVSITVNEADTDVSLSYTSTNGWYDLPFLNASNYDIRFELKQGGITYGITENITLRKKDNVQLDVVLAPENGHFTIDGIVTYQNLSALENSSNAVGALLELKDADSNTIATAISDSEGKYTLDSLSSGEGYFIEATLEDVVVYKDSLDQFDLNGNMTDQDLNMIWNGDQTLLRVEVFAQVGELRRPISHADFCLYLNESIYEIRPSACAGSFFSVKSNADGIVLLPGLDEGTILYDVVFSFSADSILEANDTEVIKSAGDLTMIDVPLIVKSE